MTQPFGKFNSIEEISEQVQTAVSPRRFQHIAGVADYARRLAQANGVDEQTAVIAAWLHDYTKERFDKDFLAAIDKHQLDPDLKKWGNPIWHGVVGAELVRDEIGIEDETILNAIRRHTTGDVEMTTLDKVIFMADYLEMGRQFDGVDQARQLTDQSLDEGVKYQLTHSSQHLVAKQAPIYPKTIAAYNHWVGGM